MQTIPNSLSCQILTTRIPLAVLWKMSFCSPLPSANRNGSSYPRPFSTPFSPWLQGLELQSGRQLGKSVSIPRPDCYTDTGPTGPGLLLSLAGTKRHTRRHKSPGRDARDHQTQGQHQVQPTALHQPCYRHTIFISKRTIIKYISKCTAFR